MTDHVVIVDDSRTTRLIIQAYFVGTNIRFTEASSGAEALAIIDRDPPGLVLCDVFMPDMDGFAFVRAMRGHMRLALREIPIILASSKRSEELSRKSIEVGANLFMSKPLAGELLARNVRTLLQRPKGA